MGTADETVVRTVGQYDNFGLQLEVSNGLVTPASNGDAPQPLVRSPSASEEAGEGGAAVPRCHDRRVMHQLSGAPQLATESARAETYCDVVSLEVRAAPRRTRPGEWPPRRAARPGGVATCWPRGGVVGLAAARGVVGLASGSRALWLSHTHRLGDGALAFASPVAVRSRRVRGQLADLSALITKDRLWSKLSQVRPPPASVLRAAGTSARFASTLRGRSRVTPGQPNVAAAAASASAAVACTCTRNQPIPEDAAVATPAAAPPLTSIAPPEPVVVGSSVEGLRVLGSLVTP